MSISLESVRDRVRELDFFLSVSTWQRASDAIANASAIPPAAFISTSSERAATNKLSTGRHRQLVLQVVSVLFALGAERADSGETDELETAKNLLTLHLTGWKADGAESPFDYVSFANLFNDGGIIWAEALFAAPYQIVIAS